MKDRVVEHPNRYRLVPVAGTSDTFDLVAVPGTVIEEGTDLNKAALLTDAAATLLASVFGITFSSDALVSEALAGIANGSLRIATGTYTGTGTYGSENPCEVYIGFTPKLVFISSASGFGAVAAANYVQNSYGWSNSALFAYPTTKYLAFGGGTTYPYRVGKISWGTTLEWYNETAQSQLNTDGTVYNVLAIG